RGSVEDIITTVGLVTALYGRWTASRRLAVQSPPAHGLPILTLALVALPLLALSVQAQTTDVGGGIEAGGKDVKFPNDSRIAGIRFRQGQQIDRYAFFGGFADGQYEYKLTDRLSLNGRGLVELSTDRKNLGGYRDGARFHARPEIEAALGVSEEWKVLAHGGVGFTHVWNDQYSKSGLNPHAGAG